MKTGSKFMLPRNFVHKKYYHQVILGSFWKKICLFIDSSQSIVLAFSSYAVYE